MSEFVRIPFRGSVIPCDYIGGRPFVALRPICQALDVEWPRQRRSIMSDPVLSSVVAEMATTAADGKTYQMLAIPLDYLNGWLFRLDAGRYKVGDPRRERIIEYQRECYRTLCHHFFHTPRVDWTERRPAQLPPAPRCAERLVARLRRIATNRHLNRAAMHAAVELACYGEPDWRENKIAAALLHSHRLLA